MNPSPHSNEINILASLNQLTLVAGANVATMPIAEELGISPDELHQALENLRLRGWVVIDAQSNAGITGEGHEQLAAS
jgi:Mn-dependent DtxR family transcriptional regulator